MASKRELAEAAYRAALAALPDCRLGMDDFLAFADREEVSREALSELGFDLVLACACGHADRAAVELLERRHLGRVEEFLGRFRPSPEELREHRQALRIRLLVGPRPGAPPGILGYRGAGPLAAWLRMTSIRLALDLFPSRAVERADSGVWARLATDTPNPELRAARDEHREVFAAALEQSLGDLPAADRTLLRLHLIDALNIDAIGTIYRVHRSTVARRLIAIREKVYASMRRRLSLELATISAELRSLARLLRKDVQLSLDRLLGQGAPG